MASLSRKFLFGLRSYASYPRFDVPVVSAVAASKSTANSIVSFLTDDDLKSGTLPDLAIEELKTGMCVTHERHQRHVNVYLGKPEKVTEHKLRQSVAKAIAYLRSCKAPHIALQLPSNLPSFSASQIQHMITQSATLSNYHFDKYKTPEKDLATFRLPQDVASDNSTDSPADASTPFKDIHMIDVVGSVDEKHLKQTQAMTAGTFLARDLANERADVANPEFLQNVATELCKQHNFGEKVLQVDDLIQNEMNLLMAVGQGSRFAPRVVAIEHQGNPSAPDDVTLLVGKGITFDTGGLNLKPTGFIENMHIDMGGSAATLGAMHTIGLLNLPVNVVGVIALAENAISEKAYKPHAIIKSMKGITVQIGNTDAEGRLALADALWWAQSVYKPHTVLDFATLTGACVVGLGEFAAGLFSNNEELTEDLVRAGGDSYERVWPMPILPEHEECLKATMADISSTGKDRYGGACTAAAFLKNFIGEKTHWAHLDIAGPGMYSQTRGQFPEGGTGFGAQVAVQYLLNKHGSN
eukprot:m.35784 g.35784  ORF g.35784 m.35784 type:complete len:525 (-) comp15823_c0_seq1:39-1613(-)